VCVPAAKTDAVLAASRERESKEREVLERLRRGEKIVDIDGLGRP
jgi:regulator of RNase E activity RraA